MVYIKQVETHILLVLGCVFPSTMEYARRDRSIKTHPIAISYACNAETNSPRKKKTTTTREEIIHHHPRESKNEARFSCKIQETNNNNNNNNNKRIHTQREMESNDLKCLLPTKTRSMSTLSLSLSALLASTSSYRKERRRREERRGEEELIMWRPHLLLLLLL